jgi:hypothetical protein
MLTSTEKYLYKPCNQLVNTTTVPKATALNNHADHATQGNANTSR